MISGVNHITFAVSELQRSFAFYAEVLGLKPVARWYRGAYLLAGESWLCLNVDPATRSGALPEYTHLAFTVEGSELREMQDRLQRAGAICWQENHSHGESFYFLDPDGHKLELHVSDLPQRLESLRQAPPRDLILFQGLAE